MLGFDKQYDCPRSDQQKSDEDKVCSYPSAVSIKRKVADGETEHIDMQNEQNKQNNKNQNSQNNQNNNQQNSQNKKNEQQNKNEQNKKY